MSLRDAMPETAAFIDAVRGAFGAAAINPQIKTGVAGIPNRFYATEAGHEAGTPFDAAGASFTLDELWFPPKKDDDANRNRGR